MDNLEAVFNILEYWILQEMKLSHKMSKNQLDQVIQPQLIKNHSHFLAAGNGVFWW